MTYPGPWKTNPNLLEVVGAPFNVRWLSYGDVRVLFDPAGPPAALMSDPIIVTTAGSGSAGANAGQTYRPDDDEWTLRLAFHLLDLVELTNLSADTPDLGISDPAAKMPPQPDTSDPDYLAGDWTEIEYEEPAGTLSVDDGIDVDFHALPSNSAADDPPVGDHIDILRLTAAEYDLTYSGDPYNPDGLTLDAPSADSSRWAAATSMPFAAGQFQLRIHFGYDALDDDRTIGFEHRYLGDTWYSTTEDYNRWQQVDLFDVSAYYHAPRWRLLYPGRPPLAHRQRRDGVASDGPPLAHLQGGTGAQRPDLAHRQQTP